MSEKKTADKYFDMAYKKGYHVGWRAGFKACQEMHKRDAAQLERAADLCLACGSDKVGIVEGHPEKKFCASCGTSR